MTTPAAMTAVNGMTRTATDSGRNRRHMVPKARTWNAPV